ncbi:MAG: hypothetical protein V7642_368 [Burkholderiales bacterium]|jgi:hypothetical protein
MAAGALAVAPFILSAALAAFSVRYVAHDIEWGRDVPNVLERPSSDFEHEQDFNMTYATRIKGVFKAMPDQANCSP